MAREGERKKKAGAAEKSMQLAEAEKAEPGSVNYLGHVTEKELNERITRNKKLANAPALPDGGEKLRANIKRIEAELARRNLEKRANRSFGAELCTLDLSDQKNIRAHKPILAQIIQKKGLSSRQKPFIPPNLLSANTGNQQRTNDEKRGIHASNSSSHLSDKDVSCHSTKENRAPSLRLHNTRRNTVTCNIKCQRGTFVVLDEDDDELEVDAVDETDQVSQRYDPEAEICYMEMECQSSESYLSSPIMNFYIRYLQKPSSQSARRKNDYHMFNTYFYEKLKQDVLMKTDREKIFSKFRRWWKGVNIFEKAYIFIPVHENCHWSLVIISIPNKEDKSGPIILHLDSLELHSSKPIFSYVKSFLVEEWKFLKKDVLHELPIAENIWNRLSRTIEEKVIEVPQQQNLYDCGLFVLFFMERFISDAPERLKKQDLDMFGRQWFRHAEASSLRNRIRNILREELKKNKSLPM